VPCKKSPQGRLNQDFKKTQFSSLEQFRPLPNKSESKVTFSSYLLQEKDEVKTGLIRPEMALFARNRSP
jgi:hypothetical protein